MSKAVESKTGGVKTMAIAGRMVSELERTSGMNESERAWRKQWLQDQALSPREPVYIRKDSPELMNPIRRAYRWPLNQFQKMLTPVLGPYKALVVRFYTGKALMGLYAVFGIVYYLKYNTNDWTNRHGWRVSSSKPLVWPGEPGFPAVSNKTPRDYFDRGFQDSIFGKKNDNKRDFLPDDEINIDFS